MSTRRYKDRVNSEDNVSRAYNYLVEEKGLPAHIASGILGNFMQESGHNLDVQAYNPDDMGAESFGLAQWRADRLDNLKKVAGERMNTIEGQLDFMMWEFENTEKRAFDKLQTAEDVEDAARLFSKYYERPHKDYAHNDKRIANAVEIYNNSKKKVEGSRYNTNVQPGTEERSVARDNVPSLEQMNKQLAYQNELILERLENQERAQAQKEEAKGKAAQAQARLNEKMQQKEYLKQLIMQTGVQFVDSPKRQPDNLPAPNSPGFPSFQEGGEAKTKDKVYHSPLNAPNAFDKEKEWIKEWMSHPEYLKRLEGNLKTTNEAKPWHSKEYFPFSDENEFFKERAKNLRDKGIKNIEDSKVFHTPYLDKNEQFEHDYAQAVLNDEGSSRYEGVKKVLEETHGFTRDYLSPAEVFIDNGMDIARSTKGLKGTSIHEFTHVSGIDKEILPLRSKMDKPSEEMDNAYRFYLGENREVYSRIMNIRYSSGLKPGEKITPERLDKIKEENAEEPLFKGFSDEQILNFLNTLASNEGNEGLFYAAEGGKKGEGEEEKPKRKMTRDLWKESYGTDTFYYTHNLDKVDITTGQTLRQLIETTSQKYGLDPAFLASTLFSEGLDHYDKFDEADNPFKKEDYGDFPVSGMRFLGLDTIGNRKKELFKKGLVDPEEYKQRAIESATKNEKGEDVISADTRDLGYGIDLVGAFLKNENDNIERHMRASGAKLTPLQETFFKNVAYNAGIGNAKQMFDSYNRKGYLKDESFISERPDQYWEGVHTHAKKRTTAGIGLAQNSGFIAPEGVNFYEKGVVEPREVAQSVGNITPQGQMRDRVQTASTLEQQDREQTRVSMNPELDLTPRQIERIIRVEQEAMELPQSHGIVEGNAQITSNGRAVGRAKINPLDLPAETNGIIASERTIQGDTTGLKEQPKPVRAESHGTPASKLNPGGIDLDRLNRILDLDFEPQAPKQEAVPETPGIDLGERGIYAFSDTDNNIKLIQQQLKDRGYNVGKIDGIYGKKTLEAVKQFQKDAKIRQDGIFGEKSLKALDKVKPKGKKVVKIKRKNG